MEEYQKRVIAEKDELDQKIAKLTFYITADPKKTGFAALHVNEQERLTDQLCAMRDYSAALEKRIAWFGKQEPVPVYDNRTWSEILLLQFPGRALTDIVQVRGRQPAEGDPIVEVHKYRKDTKLRYESWRCTEVRDMPISHLIPGDDVVGHGKVMDI